MSYSWFCVTATNVTSQIYLSHFVRTKGPLKILEIQKTATIMLWLCYKFEQCTLFKNTKSKYNQCGAIPSTCRDKGLKGIVILGELERHT